MIQINKRYANWTVLSEELKIKNKLLYKCRCLCGNETLVRKEVLITSKSISCRKCMYKVEQIRPGDIYGNWTVVQEIKTEEKRKHYIVTCKCGTIKTQKAIRLRFGDSSKCRKCGSTKHKMTHTKTYATWESMIQRCTNPKNKNFKHYGGRGISVCERWFIFENFHADMGDRPENKELDRIDNDGNYGKNNCRWISHQENLKNKIRKEPAT